MARRLLGQVGRHFKVAAGITAGAFILSGLLPEPSLAGPRTDSIANVEAAFVYQFSRYVEWPEDSFDRTGDAFAITVVGDHELSEALTKLVAEKGHESRPYRISYVDDPAKAPFAQIVFIGGKDDPGAALDAGLDFDGEALTVGEHETFTHEGGIMRLYEDDSRLRIEVNIDAAHRSRLKISSKLLDLARIVRDESD